MMSKLVLIAAAAACLVTASTAADARHRKWHHARPAPAAYQAKQFYSTDQGPARMIEVKPGVYVSSYGCITDEGYGRYMPCGAGRSN